MLKRLALVFVFVAATWSSHAEPTLGKDYNIVDPAGTAAEPTVIEFFSYTCGVCYSMEGPLDAWKKRKDKKIVFKRVPITKPILAQAFYTAQYLKVEEKVHSMIFHQIHAEKKPIRNKSDLKKVFVKAGVEEKAFEKAFKSFSVKSNTKKATKLGVKYRVAGVPSFLINNKYETSGVITGSQQALFDVLSTLPLKGF